MVESKFWSIIARKIIDYVYEYLLNTDSDYIATGLVQDEMARLFETGSVVFQTYGAVKIISSSCVRRKK